RREIVLAEELILAGGGFVHAQIAGGGVGGVDRDLLPQCEPLGCEQLLLHVWPPGQALPKRGGVGLRVLVGSEYQYLFSPGKRYVVQAHSVELSDPTFRLKRWTVVEPL